MTKDKNSKETALKPVQTSLLSDFIKVSGLDGSTGRIASALPYNLGSVPRQLEIPFDSAESELVQGNNITGQASLTNSKGSKIVVTQKERKLILALACYISKYQNGRKYKDFVAKLEKGEFPDSITLPVDIREIASILYQRTHPTQLREVTKTLNSLDGKKQIIELFDNNEKKYITFEGALIKILESVKVEDMTASDDDDNKIIYHKVNLHFGNIFFWNINKKFSMLNPRYFEISGKKGSGAESDIFDVLHETLITNFGSHLLRYKTAEQEYKTELKDKGQTVPKEVYFNEVRRRRNAALLYREKLDAVIDRAATDYRKQRQPKRLMKTIERALVVLRDEIHVISSYEIRDTASGKWVYCIFDPEYMKKSYEKVLEETKSE